MVALVVTNLLFETGFLDLLEPYDCVMANRGSKKRRLINEKMYISNTTKLSSRKPDKC